MLSDPLYLILTLYCLALEKDLTLVKVESRAPIRLCSCRSSGCRKFNYAQCSWESLCSYESRYGGKTITRGIFACDKLILTPTDIIQNFKFGCSDDTNGGLSAASDDLIGLGHGSVSTASQLYRYGEIFSYCITSKSEYKGYLAFDSTSIPANTRFIQMNTCPKVPYCFVNFTGIRFNGRLLDISHQ